MKSTDNVVPMAVTPIDTSYERKMSPLLRMASYGRVDHRSGTNQMPICWRDFSAENEAMTTRTNGTTQNSASNPMKKWLTTSNVTPGQPLDWIPRGRVAIAAVVT